MKKFTVPLFIVIFTGIGTASVNIKPVSNFDLSRYTGLWYEIARYDHVFERGLVNVTAEYGLRKDGKISVLNRGYSPEKNKWRSAEGKAFVKESGHLKVSFFGPFYSDYIIFELDGENYSYALIGSSKDSYFWMLSRIPFIQKDKFEFLAEKAVSAGYERNRMILVKQD